jgi:hypothetical protein
MTIPIRPGWQMLGAPEPDDQPGLLGAQHAPPRKPPAPKDTLWTRLSALFAGADDPRLSPEQNAAARQNALAMAGAQMLGTRGNFGETLAAGIGTGQQAGSALRAQETKRAHQQEIQALLSTGAVDEPMLRRLFGMAVSGGDMELARSLAEVIKSMQGGQAGGVWSVEEMVDPETNRLVTMRFNKRTGEMEPTGFGARRRAPQLRAVMRPDGTMEYKEWDPVTGEWTGTGQEAGSTANEKQQLAAFMLPLVRESLEQVDAFEGAPERILAVVQAREYGELLPETYQLLNTAGKVLGDGYLRLTSGAAIKEEEVRMFMSTYLPAPGDKPGNLALKRRLRTRFVEGLEMLAAKVPGQKATVLGLDGKPKEVTRRDVPESAARSATRSFFQERMR